MSQLRISNSRWGTRYLHILEFSSPVTGMMDSAQTRQIIHHFPWKALQPELELVTIFRNEADYEDFQRWVRNVQIDAQTNFLAPGVTIWWPERSIYNWTGLIRAFRAGGARKNYTPRARFTIDLVDSMVSSRTTLASLGTSYEEIYGIHTPGGVLGSGGLSVPEATMEPPAPVTDGSPVPTDSKAPLPILPGPVPTTPGGGGAGGGGGGGGTW